MAEGWTYRRAGVDEGAAAQAVERIRALAAATPKEGVVAGVGGFAGLYALAGPGQGRRLLAAGCDGVGTKLKVAFLLDRHDTVGIDAVAYCVNDVICSGARPLFFLDYLATGKLDPARVEAVVAGVAEGCRRAGCALLGGETAEMPGFYRPGEYDLAGFAVGVATEREVIDGSRVRPGDEVIGLAATGLHASGFSLVRKVLVEGSGPGLGEHLPELGRTLGEELLEPTAIYVRPLLALRERVEVRAVAHVSGGGIPGNLPRVLPQGAAARLRRGSWPVPPIFGLVQRRGQIAPEEMERTFNLGIGLCVVVPEGEGPRAVGELESLGQAAYRVGEIVPGGPGVAWE